MQACPAVNTFENRIVEILAPFSLRLRCVPGVRGKLDFHIVDDGTRLDEDLIGHYVTCMPREFWRDPKSPVIQIALPHFFICDEVCYLNQMPAWASDRAARIPGRLISGRFPTHLWPRSLNLAFEWTSLDQDFAMKRGDPVCYLFFETCHPDRPISLVRAKLTPELVDYRKRIEDVAKFTSGTFNLAKEAETQRPATLLVEES